MKKRIVTLLLTLLTILSLLPTAALAAESTGVGITPVTNPNLWTTRLNSNGQSYSYRPPTAAGRQLYCMDLGYSYRYGTESFLQSYTYRSATGADADDLWNDAVAETGLGEMDALTKENVKWMMSYVADYTGEIPGSLFMALQTYIWDHQSDKSAGGDPSGDIDAGGYANADTHDQYIAYYEWLLGQKANEDAELQAQVEEYAAQGIHASIVEDESSKWAVLATSSVSGRQTFFSYHSDRKVVTSGEPGEDPEEPSPPAGDGDITFQKVIAGTDRGLDGAVYNIYLDGQIVGSDVTSGGGFIEVNDVTEGLWSFVEQEAPSGYALDPTPHSVYVSVTDGDRQYTVTAEDEELPGIKVIKTSATDGTPIANAVYSIKGVTCSFSTSVSTGPDGTALVEDLPAGVYIVREESVPAPFVRTASEQTIALRPGKISEARFEDYIRPGLEIVKRNIADGSPIEGVTYQVRQIDGDFLDMVVTDSEGRAFLEVDPGSYEISEVNVPSHVIISEIPQTISLEPGVTRTVRFFNAFKPRLTLSKTEVGTGTPIPGTVFSLTGIDSDYQDEWVTGADGTVSGYVEPGSFEIEEISVPDPYCISEFEEERTKTVSLQPGDETTLYFENQRRPVIEIVKLNEVTLDPISDVPFQVWYASNHTTTGEYNDLGVYYTDEDGRIVLDDPDLYLRDGWFRVQEQRPAPGFALPEEDTQEVFIPAGGSHTFRFENRPLSAICVWKYDSETGAAIEGAVFRVRYLSGNTSGTGGTVIGTYETSANGSFTVTGCKVGTYIIEELSSDGSHVIDTPPQTVYLSGEEQEVVRVEFGNSPKGSLLVTKVSTDAEKTPLSDVEFLVTTSDGTVVGNANGKYVTDSSGSFLVENVDPGTTLVVRETRAKPGYLLDDTPQTAQIKAGQTVTLEFRNQPLGNLIIHKLDSVTKEPLTGVQFKITYADGSFLPAEGGKLSSNGLYWTNSEGQIVLSNVTGTVVATEIQTIPGYTIDPNTQSQTVVVNPDDTQELWFYNTPVGGVELVKVNAADKTERLSDAVFEIRKASDDALVDTVTTGDTGTVFAPLAEGDYYALEQESPSGFKLDSTRHYFTVRDGEVTQEVIENEAISGILLHKVDGTTGEGIPGVSFILYDSGHNPIDQQTTDDRGYAWFEDLKGGSRFYLRELENEGYIPDTQLRTVYVKAGETTEVTWENTPITGQIQIVKKSADYNPTNGLPAGTLLEGAVFEIYDKVGNLVDTIKSDSRGLAVSKQLPLSRYTIREVKSPANYGINEEVLTAYLEYEGQILRFEVTDKSLTTGVSITKTGPKEAMSGQPVNYTFSGIANTSNVRLDSFYWRDTLPAQVRLNTVVTGTYNFSGTYKITYRVNGGEYHYGYQWCGGPCRWATTEKLRVIRDYCADAVIYVGLAADEPQRFEKCGYPNRRLPLAEWGLTEPDCLEYCQQLGFQWLEETENGPVPLYDILDRVSCWCCGNKNLKELKHIYLYLPQYWERLKGLQAHMSRPMKGWYQNGSPKGVFELERRFAREIKEATRTGGTRCAPRKRHSRGLER